MSHANFIEPINQEVVDFDQEFEDWFESYYGGIMEDKSDAYRGLVKDIAYSGWVAHAEFGIDEP